MKAVILAAGYATRLYPLTATRPKPLLPVAGRPMLDWIVDRLAGVPAIDGAYLVSNARFAGQFQSWISSARLPWPMELINDGSTTDQDKLGAVGDLHLVLERRGRKDDLLVIAGDNLLAMDLGRFADDFARRRAALVALKDMKGSPRISQYSVVRLDADLRVVEFEEKPAYPHSSLIAICVYAFPAHELGLVDRYLAQGGNRDAPGYYIQWLCKAARVYGHPFDDVWFDIGDIDSYNEANRVFRGMAART